MAQQGSPPRRSSRQPGAGYRDGYERAAPRPRRPERPVRPGWEQYDPFRPEPDTDANLPPWAEPAGHQPRPAARQRPRPEYAAPDHAPPGYDEPADEPADDSHYRSPAGRHHAGADTGAGPAVAADRPRRPVRGRGRAAATRLRKSRRRVVRWCGIAIAVCVIAAGIAALVTHHSPRQTLFVTSLLPGEYKSVPSACGSVSQTVLNQYVPGPGRTVTNELASATDSECSFTVDRKPVFLVLEVTAQAYQPFAAATAAGTAPGSASANAENNLAQVQQGLAKPPRRSPVSAAQITALSGTGQQAFVAVAREHVSGIVTEVVTVVIRQRNVLITVSESGQESGGGFGPVSVATLEAGAEAAARGVLAEARTQPTA